MDIVLFGLILNQKKMLPYVETTTEKVFQRRPGKYINNVIFVERVGPRYFRKTWVLIKQAG